MKLHLCLSNVIALAAVLAAAVGTAESRLAVESAAENYYEALSCRKHSASIADFGGVGDGKTSNTKAFNDAVANLSKVAGDGGAQLFVPPGKWLTGSFNLTSHFTLYLHKDAIILGSQEESEYPSIPVLPSYGRGRDAPGGRYASLIWGTNLTDVVITGNNGTINGQGSTWWKKFKAGKLDKTRPYIIEIMYSDHIQISNLTLIDSPSWNVHPVYSSFVLVSGLTVIAPVDVPNTDGINPDSCSHVLIEKSYVISGDDCIAIKSGWDQYGIKVGIPTRHVIIRDFTCVSPDSAGIALGSEMSGGISDVRADGFTAIDTQSGIRIKTAVGRGGYVRDIYARNFVMKTMRYVFWMTGDYGSHPDPGWDPKALPVIENINYLDMVAENATMAGQLAGIDGDRFRGVCLSNVKIGIGENKKKKAVPAWNCTNIEGVASDVRPKPCGLIKETAGVECKFPTDRLPIEDLRLVTCAASSR